MHATNTNRARGVEQVNKSRENVYGGSRKSLGKTKKKESGMTRRYDFEEKCSKSGGNKASSNKVEREAEVGVHICLNDFKTVQNRVKEITQHGDKRIM